MKYFDVTKDKTYPYFCQACLVGKDEMSQDERYCPSCYNLLDEQAEITTPVKWSQGGQVCYIGDDAWVSTSAKVKRSLVEKAIKEGTEDSLINKIVQQDLLGIIRDHEMQIERSKRHVTRKTTRR